MVSFVLMCCLGQNQGSQCLGDTLSKEQTVDEERRPPAAHGSRAEENRRNIGPSLLPYQRRSHSRPSRRKRAKGRGPNRKETPTMTLSRTIFAKTAGISRVAGTAECSYRRKSCMGKNAKPTARSCFSSSLLTWLPRRFEASSDPKWRRERIANESRRRPPITTLKPERALEHRRNIFGNGTSSCPKSTSI